MYFTEEQIQFIEKMRIRNGSRLIKDKLRKEAEELATAIEMNHEDMIIDELADVLVFAQQLLQDPETLENLKLRIDFKIKRTLKRHKIY